MKHFVKGEKGEVMKKNKKRQVSKSFLVGFVLGLSVIVGFFLFQNGLVAYVSFNEYSFYFHEKCFNGFDVFGKDCAGWTYGVNDIHFVIDESWRNYTRQFVKAELERICRHEICHNIISTPIIDYEERACQGMEFDFKYEFKDICEPVIDQWLNENWGKFHVGNRS